MSKPLPRFTFPVSADRRVAAPQRPRFVAPFDLVHLARQSSGDKARETELLGLFDHQAGLALARLRDLQGCDSARSGPIARMLASAARTVGAFAVAAACDGYAAILETDAPPAERRQALQIVAEEIGIARASLADLLAR